MDHVAIMEKSWGLTQKIISGQKKIESRWYQNRYQPWDRIKKGETIYFKNSGEKVSLKAEVKNVLQFSSLTPNKVKELLVKYGKDDGIEKEKINDFYDLFKNKKYCILVFLDGVKEIEPFDISKKGFGLMAAWITLPNINTIKIN